jgi:hypothetical protein
VPRASVGTRLHRLRGSMIKEASIARVALRFLAMEFPTEEALKSYLEKHPKANRSKHTVRGPAGKGDSRGDSKSRGKPYDYPEYSNKSSPYYVNQDNKHLKKLGDPSEWNYMSAMRLKEKLKDKSSAGVKNEKEQKVLDEAIRQIGNWGLLAHQKNRDQVDQDSGWFK